MNRKIRAKRQTANCKQALLRQRSGGQSRIFCGRNWPAILPVFALFSPFQSLFFALSEPSLIQVNIKDIP
ncbi:hypothetical protein A4H97_25270 [Niastella yeongjuensis]|uniref:Uncharacterized protein n=1 Tax=Niastella yeongjuensis TaxID=354355 RepID=A0A1V9F2R8_9BACT|nr:hypothetical protein A4H97_25270 [Niastella yeongjuensis]